MKRLVLEGAHTNLSANDLSANVVVLEQAHAHLLEQELDLLALLHRAVGFHLQLLEDGSRLVNIRLALFDGGQFAR